MKNNKGFTLVEVVATFAILAVIMGIGVLSFNYVFNRVSDDYYHTIENSLLLSGNEYYQDHRDELPVNGYNKVAVKTLIDNHYIEPIKDKNGNLCTEGDVYIYPKEQGQYDYDVCLKCGDYESEGGYCDAETESNHQIVIPTTIMCQLKMFSTYTGSPITLTKTRETEGYTFNNNIQTGAGEYTITAKLKAGWKWSDNTENDKTIKCTLHKATPKIELDPNKGLVLIGKTRNFSEKVNTNGTIKNTILNNNIIDATPTEKDITGNISNTVAVTGKNLGDTKIRVTFVPNDTANYNIIDENSNGVKEFNIKSSNGVGIPSSPNTKMYTGKEQVHGIIIPEGVSIDESESTISARNAGEYRVVLKLDDPENNAWSDGTTGPKVIIWKITKVDTVTTLSNVTRTYNGSRQGATEGGSILGNNSDTTGGSYTYKYYTNSTCTQGETTNAPINAGTYYVKATLVGTINYNTSTSECVKYTMNKKEISVSWGSTASFVYNENAQAPTVNVQTGVNGETMTLERTTKVDAGSYTSTASCKSVTGGQGLCSNYTLKNTTKDYTITPKPLQIPSIPDDKTYNGSEQNSGITCPTGSTAGGNTKATNVGTYTQTCTLTSTRNYKWSDGTTSVKSISWKINRKATTMSLSPASGTLTYGTNGSTTVTTDGDGTISCSSSNTSVATCSVSGKTVTIIPQASNGDGKTATITISQGEGTNYAATSKTYSVTVNRKALTCPSSPAAKTYNGNNQNSGITCPSGSTAGGSTTGKNANTYYQSCTASNGYKFSGTCNVSWIINKKATTMSLSSSSGTLTYGTNGTTTVTTNGDGTISCSSSNTSVATCSVSGKTVTIIPQASNGDGKTATITISQAAGTNYGAASKTYSVTVNRKALTCPSSPSAKTYTGSSQNSGITCPSGSTAGGSTTGKDANTYYQSCTASNGYKFSGTCNVSWVINKKATTMSLSPASGTLTYGTNGSTTVTTNGDGTISCSSSNTAVATCSVSGKTVTIIPQASNGDGKTATITISQAAGTNYGAASKTYSVTVNRKALTCPSSPSAKTYTGSSQNSGITCPSGSTAGGSTTGKDANTYYQSCTASNGYKFSGTCNVSWVINKKATTMSLSPASGTLTYGTNGSTTVTTNGDGTISCSSSNTAVATCSVSGKTVTIIPQASNGDNKTATITISQGAGTNYAAASKTYSVTVNRKALTCPSSPSAKTYNGNNQNSGITCPSGSTAGGSTTGKDANTYYQSCTASNGYKFSGTCNVSWVINKKATTMSLSATSGTLTYGTNGTITVTTDGDGTISCSSSNTAVATCSVSGKTIIISGKAAGSATITISQAAGTNYAAASKTYAVTVNNSCNCSCSSDTVSKVVRNSVLTCVCENGVWNGCSSSCKYSNCLAYEDGNNSGNEGGSEDNQCICEGAWVRTNCRIEWTYGGVDAPGGGSSKEVCDEEYDPCWSYSC